QHLIHHLMVVLVLIVVQHQAVRDAKPFEKGNVAMQVVLAHCIDDRHTVPAQIMPISGKQPRKQGFLGCAFHNKHSVCEEHGGTLGIQPELIAEPLLLFGNGRIFGCPTQYPSRVSFSVVWHSWIIYIGLQPSLELVSLSKNAAEIGFLDLSDTAGAVVAANPNDLAQIVSNLAYEDR